MRRIILLFSCLCSFWLAGCDTIFKKQVTIDFRKTQARSFIVAGPEDMDKVFSRIGAIAEKDGLRCGLYDAARKRYVCAEGTVKLAAYVTSERAINVELTQFGPWSKTQRFIAVENDLSDFIREEFPGHGVLTGE